jgi:carbamoyl-phosphate synthase large subunit
MYEALRKGLSVEELYQITYIKPWFIEQMKELVDLEEKLLGFKGQIPPTDLLIQAKKDGFADRYLSECLGISEAEIREKRLSIGLKQAWNAVPVSGADAAYYYSTYNTPDEVRVSDKRKIMILGGGPNRIGQGIEFDYTCVHAAFTLRDLDYESIMVNCNPETVSTDYDTSNKLYFEPITVEDVLSIYDKEKPEGVIVQFGGQTPLNIASELDAAGVNILGTSVDSIDLAEDRERFSEVIRKLDIPAPDHGTATSLDEAIQVAGRIGYPLLVRPSYVLGGRGMEIVFDEKTLVKYVKAAVDITPDKPMLIDKFLEDALECETDAISDGEQVFIPAVMEHIELAGIHSGDSACVIPPVGIGDEHMETIKEYTRRIAIELEVIGLMNIQYAIYEDEVYILEANPRASRTVPLVSKVAGVPMARMATEVILGKKVKDLSIHERSYPHYGVKETVFPFNMFPEVDPVLGPEMRSTGEVLGLADSFPLAFHKGQIAAGFSPPLEGGALITVASGDKSKVLPAAVQLAEMGFKILATEGTMAYLKENGVDCIHVKKLHEGRPHIIDAITNGEIQMIINTPVGKESVYDDSYIRKAAIKYKIPYFTTTAAGRAAVKGIRAAREGLISVDSLQSYHLQVN